MLWTKHPHNIDDSAGVDGHSDVTFEVSGARLGLERTLPVLDTLGACPPWRANLAARREITLRRQVSRSPGARNEFSHKFRQAL